jgi:hypothetical protein
MKTVPLHGKKAAGRVALVDDEDYELVSQYRWQVKQASRPGSRDDGPYAITTITHADGRRSMVYMHILIMGHTGIDHRNGDGLDNQRGNLRAATNSQNAANQGPRAGTSRFKGVHLHRGRKWLAYICVNGRQRHLGMFFREEDAARAYDAAAREAFGTFARLNFEEDT